MPDVYRALDDDIRRLLLDLLAERAGQTSFELCGALVMRHGVTMSRQAISQHLSVLEDAGLVRAERRGRTKLHAFDPAPLTAIVARWPVSHPVPPERTDP